jgi:hypothetical protein
VALTIVKRRAGICDGTTGAMVAGAQEAKVGFYFPPKMKKFT